MLQKQESLAFLQQFLINFVEPPFFSFFFVRQPEALIPFGALVGVLVETCQVCRACVAWADFGCNFCTKLKVYTLMEYEGKENKMQLGFAWKAFADFFQSLGMSPSNFTTIKFPLASQGDSPKF